MPKSRRRHLPPDKQGSSPESARQLGVPKRPTVEDYEAVVAACLAVGMDRAANARPERIVLAEVARKLGRPVHYVKRAWHEGWPRWGFVPVKERFEQERVETRARRARVERDRAEASESAAARALIERERRLEAAREDARMARTEEASLIQASRRNALSLAVVTAQVLQGALTMSEKVKEKLAVMASAPNIDVREAMGIIRQISAVVRLGTEAGKMAVQMERLALGEPVDPVDAKAAVSAELSSSIAWVEKASGAVRRYEMRRQLAVSFSTDRSVIDAEPSDVGGSDEDAA